MSKPLTTPLEVREDDLIPIKSLIDNGDYQQASRLLGEYLAKYQHSSLEAWFLLGRVMLGIDQPHLAWLIYAFVVRNGGGNQWQSWLNFGKSLDRIRAFSEAQDAYAKALELNPSDESALTALGTSYVMQARAEEAEKTLRKAIAQNPQNGMAHSSLGFALLQQRRWGEGWDEYEWGAGKLKDRIERMYAPNEPRWTGEKGKHIRLAVHGEQGIGDQLIASEVLRSVAADVTITSLECTPKIHGLLQRSYPDVDVYPTLHERGIEWPAKKRITHHASLYTCLRHYRRAESDYTAEPFLVADPARRLQWRALLDSLGPEPKIGISWTGGTIQTMQSDRNIELETLIPLLRMPAHWVSLEYRDRSDDLAALKRRRGITIHQWPWGTQTDDYDDTAALVAELDMVITVAQSVVHLAGGLGVPCWVMLHEAPNIHYAAHGDHIPAYGDRVRLFRRGGGEWGEVVKRIVNDLRLVLDERHAA